MYLKELIATEQENRSGILNIAFIGLKRVPNEIGKLKWLHTLFMDYNMLDDGTIRSMLGKFQTLISGSNQLRNLSILSELQNLEKLSLGSNQIKELHFLVNLTTLKELNLARNLISDLSFLANLTNLKELNLAGNLISDLSFLANLTNLTELILVGNQISDHSYLENLINLEKLNLGSNHISDLSFLANLTNLKELYLEYTQISDLSFLRKLTDLKKLDLGSNEISDLSFLENLTNLKKLDLGSNQISDISFLENLIELEELDLGSNQISDLHSLENLTNLEKLDLSSNQISDISFLENLIKLEELDLESNQISDLHSLENLANLEKLNLSSNQISDIHSLENLTNLEKLDISSNQISDLHSFENLTNLKNLYLGSNQINDLRSLENLTNLEQLELQNNEISDLSPIKGLIVDKELSISIEAFSIDDIDVSNNPLITPPAEIVTNGRNAVKQYFEELGRGSDYLYEAKLLIVGDGRVGKTTLEKKLRDENAKMPEESETTFGIDIDKYTFTTNDGNDFTINIWDFGGQDKYYPSHQFFLTKRSLYILVDDASRDDIDLDYWLQAIELLSDKSPVILVQNRKTDRGKGLDERGLRSRYKNIFKFFAFNFSIPSEFDRNELRKLKKEVEHQIQQLPHIGQELPSQWIKIRQELDRKEKNNPHISQQTYFDTCEKFGLEEEERALFLGLYLHDLGVILHFQDDEILSKIVILENEWATHGVYKVLDDIQVIDNNGRFSLAYAKSILSKSEYKNMHFELIGLMKKFELCYALPGTNNTEYIAPQLLPLSQPTYNWDNEHNLRLFYSYEFMPKGVLSRFIVRLNHLVNKKDPIYWRRGVILERKNTKAEVIESYGSKKIDIRINGAYSKELLTLIVEDLDTMNKSFNLKIPKFVPCICDLCKTLEKPHFYEFEKLETRKEKGKQTVECEKSYENVSVNLLIDNVFVDPRTIDDESLKSLRPLRLFLTYSKKNHEGLGRLKTLLRPLERENKIEMWDDSKLSPAEDWDDDIKNELKSSDVIVCLVSMDFLATDYIWKTELSTAKKNKIKILPVIFDYCSWDKYEVLSKRNALPPKAYPIKSTDNWETEDQAWLEVDKGIRKLIENLNK